MARIDNPTTKDLIVALNDMDNSLATICNGIDSLKSDFEEYGIHDWFNHALETQYIEEYQGEEELLGDDYDIVFVSRNPKTLKMHGFCEDTIDYIYNNAKSLQSEPESIKSAHSYNSVSRPNKTQVIEAFKVLDDSMYTFACGVGGYYGVSDAVEKDLGEDWFNEMCDIKPTDHPYYDTFASSYDESTFAMSIVREGFEDYINNGGKVIFQKSEKRLKIRVHEASPRKWRAEPEDRGTGKYGPGQDSLIAKHKQNVASAENWLNALKNDYPLQDTVFVNMLNDELDDECMRLDDIYGDTLIVRPNYAIDMDTGCSMYLVLDPEMPDEKTAKRFCDILLKNKKLDSQYANTINIQPIYMTANNTPVDEDNWYIQVVIKMDLVSTEWGQYWLENDVTRKGACLEVSERFSDTVEDIIKAWRPIKAEVSRKFGKQESICSMQKKIESLRKA